MTGDNVQAIALVDYNLDGVSEVNGEVFHALCVLYSVAAVCLAGVLLSFQVLS